MTALTDMIDREIKVDDYVVFYSNIYQVKGLGKARDNGRGSLKMILMDKSKTTKAVTKFSKDVCLVDKEDVVMWLLKGRP
jgi:hypothetical protein